MSTIDENALRERFTAEFDPAGPFPQIGSAPVDAVIRRGRAIRTRRRAALGGGLAALAAVVVGMSALLNFALASRATANPVVRHHVAVDRLGPTARGGVIGSGTVDGTRWSMTVTIGALGVSCFQFAVGPDHGSPSCAPFVTAKTDLAEFDGGFRIGEPVYESGPVRADVAQVLVDLVDGETLSVPSVAVGGQRYAAFAIPRGLGISRLTLFSASGDEIAYSEPYNSAGNLPMITTWYQAGQVPTQATASGPIASGRLSTGPWSVDVAVGAFGECFSVTGIPGFGSGTSCEAPWTPQTDQVMSSWSETPDHTLAFGELNPRVDYLIAVLSDGRTVRVEPVVVGGLKFGAAVFAPGVRVLSLTSYDSAGHELGQQGGLTPAS